MKKKTIFSLSIVLPVLLFSFSGCKDKAVVYDENLGIDLGKVENIDFRIYHSNSTDHTWELLTTLSCPSEGDYFADVRLEGTENGITVISEKNHVDKTKDSEVYYSEDLEFYEHTVEGFHGQISDFQTFNIKDTSEEQFFRLYAISNNPGVYYPKISLEQPYDEEEENLDNILITVVLQQ